MVPGTRASWELVGDQLKGQRAIVGYQREELAIREIGEVYKLNTPDAQTSQFVRVTSVDHSVVTFTYNNYEANPGQSNQSIILHRPPWMLPEYFRTH